MDFTGNSGPLLRYRRSGFFHIQAIERLVFIQRLFNLRRRTNTSLDQFPHEFRAGAADDRDAHPMEVQEKLSHVDIAGHIDDQINLIHRQQLSIVRGNGNLQLCGKS